jgi:hypothetical protein
MYDVLRHSHNVVIHMTRSCVYPFVYVWPKQLVYTWLPHAFIRLSVCMCMCTCPKQLILMCMYVQAQSQRSDTHAGGTRCVQTGRPQNEAIRCAARAWHQASKKKNAWGGCERNNCGVCWTGLCTYTCMYLVGPYVYMYVCTWEILYVEGARR